MADVTENREVATEPETPEIGEFSFLKGSANQIETPSADDGDWAEETNKVQNEITKAMDGRNLAFLLAAGCSSLIDETVDETDNELGVSTMEPLAKDFTDDVDGNKEWSIRRLDCDRLKKNLGIDIGEQYSENLEDLLMVLHASKLMVERGREDFPNYLPRVIDDTIDKLETFFFIKVNINLNSEGGGRVRKIYESFYKRILFRGKTQSRPWVFTTNYDLLNERSMDNLGIAFCNGFSGGLTRHFNPATFQTTVARQLDVSDQKWSALENFIYLGKLHGSINWFYDDESINLWPITEWASPRRMPKGRLMIYPTPAKVGQSLGSPYSDLFREFQGRIVREQSVLITIGYSFSDEHINNIIYQALSIPSFRLIIFADPNQTSNKDIQKLLNLGDPRIWIIGGGKTHYFKSVVDNFLPNEPEDKVNETIRSLTKALKDDGTS